MSQPTDFGTYIKENKALLQRYIETRTEIIRLQLIRSASRAIGSLIWLMVVLFLFFLILIFIGLVLGFLFSDITGSFVAGFSISGGILLVFALLLTLFRKIIFIHPTMRLLISLFMEDKDQEEYEVDEPSIKNHES